MSAGNDGVESETQSAGCIPLARPESQQATCCDSGTGSKKEPRYDQGDGVGPPSLLRSDVELTEAEQEVLARAWYEADRQYVYGNAGDWAADDGRNAYLDAVARLAPAAARIGWRRAAEVTGRLPYVEDQNGRLAATLREETDKRREAEAALAEARQREERVRALASNWFRLSATAMDAEVREWTKAAATSVLTALDGGDDA